MKGSLHDSLQKLCALLLASAVLWTPLSRAQDDEMPDGDADLVEKPKKKDPPKKDPPKKEAKKPKKEEPKKDEPKPEPKKPEPKPPADDDDDLLTGDDPPPRTAPPPKEPPPKKGADPLIENVLVDEDEDDLPAGSTGARTREPVKEERAPLPTTALDADDPPSRTDRSVNVRGDDDLPVDGAAKKAAERAPVGDANDGDGNDGDMKSIEVNPIDEPDESEGAPTGLIVGGAIGGALVLLAGAGVGGYFLVQSLSGGGGGTVTINPR